MEEGKTLLINILKSRLKDIYTNNDLDENDLASLSSISNELDNDVESLKYINEKTIDAIIEDNNYQTHPTFKKRILQIKEIIKKDKKFRYKINNSETFSQALLLFERFLKIYLTNRLGEQIGGESEASSINEILNKIKKDEAITNLDLIEKIVNEYDNINFENNMLNIMKFINNHNLTIFKSAEKEPIKYELGELKNKELDDNIKSILNYLNISFYELPNALKREVKQCDPEEVYETFELVKKEKEERYGILHLINEENYIIKLCIILFATPYSVRTVVDSLKDNEGVLYLETINNILNYVPTSIMIKQNEYLIPKFSDYVSNINFIKENNVSHRSLINRAPLFMISNNELINETTNYFEMLGANKKIFINKCYKTLSTNPYVLVTNAEILSSKIKIDFNAFLKQDNYNLLKVPNLEKKLNCVIKENKLSKDNLDYEELNKLLITKVYTDSIRKSRVWGEIE